VLDVWLGYTPLGCCAAHQPYLRLSVRKKAAGTRAHTRGVAVRDWFTRGIFAEDKDIVEHEQRAYRRARRRLEKRVFPAIRDLAACWAVAAAPWSKAAAGLRRTGAAVPLSKIALANDCHNSYHVRMNAHGAATVRLSISQTCSPRVELSL